MKKPNNLVGLEFLDRKQAAEYIGMSDHWLEKHASNPDAPRWFRHGRKSWYKRTDLDAWIAQRERATKDLDNIWERAEKRRIGQPSAADLKNAYEEEFAEDLPAPASALNAEDAFRRLFGSLSPAQRELLVSAMTGPADPKKQ